jgi:hypothetical protein
MFVPSRNLDVEYASLQSRSDLGNRLLNPQSCSRTTSDSCVRSDTNSVKR